MNTHRALLPLLLAATQACASSAAPGTPPSGTPAPGTSAPAARPDADRIARLEAIYEARADSLLLNPHEADVHFITGMIGHHAQALVMAGFAPDNGASPAVQVLCARIINAQSDEIAIMQRWLRERGLPVPEIHIEGATLMVHGPEHAVNMPGMISPEQLRELGEARGPDFDRLFLTYMIQHHEGAVTMVHDLFAADGAAQGDFIFKIASDIQVDQATEIARMELMLEEMTTPGR